MNNFKVRWMSNKSKYRAKLIALFIECLCISSERHVSRIVYNKVIKLFKICLHVHVKS